VGLSGNTQRFDTTLRCGDQVAGHPRPTRPVSLLNEGTSRSLDPLPRTSVDGRSRPTVSLCSAPTSAWAATEAVGAIDAGGQHRGITGAPASGGALPWFPSSHGLQLTDTSSPLSIETPQVWRRRCR
jgi:hypothetical protein